MQKQPYGRPRVSVKSPEPFFQIPESILALAVSGTISLHEMLVWSVVFRERFRGRGYCQKSTRTLALELHFSTSTVFHALRKLHRMRLLIPVPARTPRSTKRWVAKTPAQAWDDDPTVSAADTNCIA